MKNVLLTLILVLYGGFGIATISRAQSPTDLEELVSAFKGAQVVDLRTSKITSVVTLRDIIKIPPPSEPVLVKVFKREELPPVLQPAFSRPGVTGVTIRGRYIAILHTEFRKEYEDILRHELVHAYVTLTSPKPLPFWFQEAGAVLFSTGKGRKFYGQPSKTQAGVTVGKVVDLDPTYKQKLQSFNYLIEKAGKQKFYEWYRNCVLTGEVKVSKLLDESKPATLVRPPAEGLPVWLWVVAAAVVIVIAVVGFYAVRYETGYE